MTGRQFSPEAQTQYDELTYLFEQTLAGCDADDAKDTLDALLDSYRDQIASEHEKKANLEDLREDAAKLRALEQAGVDNWSGYDYAMEILHNNQTTGGL